MNLFKIIWDEMYFFSLVIVLILSLSALQLVRNENRKLEERKVRALENLVKARNRTDIEQMEFE